MIKDQAKLESLLIDRIDSIKGYFEEVQSGVVKALSSIADNFDDLGSHLGGDEKGLLKDFSERTTLTLATVLRDVEFGVSSLKHFCEDADLPVPDGAE